MQSIFAIIQTNENMSSMMKCVRATDLQNKLNKPDFFLYGICVCRHQKFCN